MEDMINGTAVQAPQKKKKRGWLVLLLLLLITVAVVASVWLLRPRQQSRYELDANALAGFLPGKSESEIQAELNRIIEQGNFNISINPTPTVLDDGSINVRIENVPANNYWMQVDIYLTDEAGADTLLYASGVIKQGFYIESAQILGDVPASGKYNCRAEFSAIDPESEESIGQAAATLLVTVAGEASGDD